MSEQEFTVEVPGFEDATVVERINKKDLKPLWDEHEHEFKLDPTDESDVYFAQVCVTDGCGLGRLVRKS